MIIQLEDLLHGGEFDTLPLKHQYNLEVTLDRVNEILVHYADLFPEEAKTLKSNSGYRSKEHHIRVYKDLAKQRKQEFNEDKIPWGSQHLVGNATDINDPKGHLFSVIRDDKHPSRLYQKLEDVGLWCEEADDQPRVHFQTVPPRSGKRFFSV